jgi:3',5'-cyclic-AMP phosphodiesterase
VKPVLLAQLSDLHLGADWEGVDPRPRLERVIAAVRALRNPVDAVVVSGDLSDDGSDQSYEAARELLARFDVPVHVLPGNHDDRAGLRRAFGLPGAGADPVDYTAEVGALRLVVLDSSVPGQDPGAFDPGQLRWLDRELGREPNRPAILVLHHPPLPTGIPEWDEINLAVSEREALAAVVGRHPQLRVIAGGHLHRTAASALAGRPVLSVPSTYFQGRPDFQPRDFANEEFVNCDPPGFALHVLRDGELSSQVELLGAVHGG